MSETKSVKSMTKTATAPTRGFTSIPASRRRQPVFGDADWKCPLDHTPNAETIAAFNEGDAIRAGGNYKRYTTVEEFLSDLHSDDGA
jgi:hypothetical protein